MNIRYAAFVLLAGSMQPLFAECFVANEVFESTLSSSLEQSFPITPIQIEDTSFPFRCQAAQSEVEKVVQQLVDSGEKYGPQDWCETTGEQSITYCSYQFSMPWIHDVNGEEYNCENPSSHVRGTQSGVKLWFEDAYPNVPENQFYIDTETGLLSYRTGCNIQTFVETPSSQANPLCEANN